MSETPFGQDSHDENVVLRVILSKFFEVGLACDTACAATPSEAVLLSYLLVLYTDESVEKTLLLQFLSQECPTCSASSDSAVVVYCSTLYLKVASGAPHKRSSTLCQILKFQSLCACNEEAKNEDVEVEHSQARAHGLHVTRVEEAPYTLCPTI